MKACEESGTEVSFLHTTFFKSAVRVRNRQMDIQTYRQMAMQSDRQTDSNGVQSPLIRTNFGIIEVNKDAESG